MVSKQKCLDYIENKWPFMIIFQYNVSIFFVWIQHGCLANKTFALDSSSSVIKRLGCNNSMHFISVQESNMAKCLYQYEQ